MDTGKPCSRAVLWPIWWGEDEHPSLRDMVEASWACEAAGRAINMVMLIDQEETASPQSRGG